MSSPGPFVLFANSHLWPLAVVLALAVALPLLARRSPKTTTDRIAKVIAIFLVSYRLGAIPMHARIYELTLVSQLPFQICGILFFVCAYMLWTKSYGVFEVAYFWAIAGTLQALVTPDLRYAFPHPEFLIFFFSHGVLVATVFYALFVFGFRPRPASILKAFAATLLYAAFLVPVNWLLDTNFMYLREKPMGASMLDTFGEWPWYLAGAGSLILVLFSICYAPFALTRRRSAPDS